MFENVLTIYYDRASHRSQAKKKERHNVFHEISRSNVDDIFKIFLLYTYVYVYIVMIDLYWRDFNVRWWQMFIIFLSSSIVIDVPHSLVSYFLKSFSDGTDRRVIRYLARFNAMTMTVIEIIDAISHKSDERTILYTYL